MNGNMHHCVRCDQPAIVDGEVQFETVLIGEVDGIFQYSCWDCSETECDGVTSQTTFPWTRACDIAIDGTNVALTTDEILFIRELLKEVDPLTLPLRWQSTVTPLAEVFDNALPY